MGNDLLRAVLAEYELPWMGIHGLPHWARVLENGRKLAVETDAKLEVVELFAVFHDACRLNDDSDPEHGSRAAGLARSLQDEHLRLSEYEFDLLCFACAHHTAGLTEADVTVQTCWDADRLDLARVGIRPRADRLCTSAAKNPAIIDWAVRRSVRDGLPTLMATEWKIDQLRQPPRSAGRA